MLHLLDLVGVRHGVEHRGSCPRAYVAPQTDDYTGLEHTMQLEEATSEKQVRVRAMCDPRSAAGDEIELFLRQPDAVGQHTPIAQQPVVVVDVRVLRIGEELLH